MLTKSPAWLALQAHYEETKDRQIREMFAADSGRAARYQLSTSGITLDYSKNRISDSTLELLVNLAAQQNVECKRDAMFRGDKINLTEQRAVLHTALRSPAPTLTVDGENVMSNVHTMLDKVADFVDAVHSGAHLGYAGKRIETVVNIGIGGSDLGPKMVTTALAHAQPEGAPRAEFVSNIDDAQFIEVTGRLNPETTLFIIASKTFTTQETMCNAHTARDWFLAQTGGKGDVSKHFVAVSTALTETKKFGIDDDNVFAFWDWVGGRYSLWSTIGLSIALSLGMENFRDLLAGGHAMDRHFCTAPLPQNMPVLLALLGIWYNNFHAAQQYLILPYSYQLKEFPAYIQQLDMESNGKSVNLDGEFVDYATGPVVWGGLGSNAQHAFYQLVHQGTHQIPTDFIVAGDSGGAVHHTPLVANFIGQMQALMRGKSREEVSVELTENDDKRLLAHKYFAGNRPSNAIVLDALNARNLGALIALYEHKVFVQGAIWHINSFDQWGVELGKQLARRLEPALTGAGDQNGDLDASTQGLVDLLSG